MSREPLPARVELTILHTADTHSQLFPFRLLIGPTDAVRGLGAAGEVRSVGGFARLATLLREERAAAERVLTLDSGDLFQGSLAFQTFQGEPELLAFDALGVEAQALGNHELDLGADLVLDRYRTLATFPLLAANYASDGDPTGLAGLVQPFTVLDAGGLRVGVIGVGNTGSVRALRARPSELGAVALEAAPAVQSTLDLLRPEVDLVVAVTHVGLDADRTLAERTSGLDLILGGHQHLTLDEPLVVDDCAAGSVVDAWGRTRRCHPRRVPVLHSGAYGKVVGRLRLVVAASNRSALDGYEVESLTLELLPVSDRVSEDPTVVELLAPYADALGAADPGRYVAFAPTAVERVGVTSGDSPLGNLAATAVRHAALADLSVIGASSLRFDLPPGLVEPETLGRVLPFADPVVVSRVSGSTLLASFERAARAAAARDCRTQVQIAGAVARLRCPCSGGTCARVWVHDTGQACRDDLDCGSFEGICDAEPGHEGRCRAPVEPEESYVLATTEYLAEGGSGLLEPIPEVERRVVGDGLASAVLDWVKQAPACGGALDCGAPCVRAALDAFRDGDCERARALCAALPCLDEGAGVLRDGRLRFEAP